ncbi:tetratricopeptide repeat protein [Tenacibaculum xiamenense]|uniref:tetratricopeptide repeat protein n=1 Tax=Tenacibaculum xiamenense TaxID=1261553 RepID=UPI0038966617
MLRSILTLLFSTFLLISCKSDKNSDAFINNSSGRYFFNADEAIEVYFKDNVLFVKWRNKELKPLKVNDSTFYVREMNEKLVFNIDKNQIQLAPKREHHDKEYVFAKLKNGEKTPKEYLKDNNYEKALAGYLAIQKKDSLSPIIRQRTLNRLGYSYLREGETENAINVFKINTVLYPKSSNTFDSLGDAYLKNNDTLNAIDNYKKALTINSENRSSKRKLDELTKKKKQ